MTADLAHPLTVSLLGGGFVAAFLHAALPTHWLPFVLVGRAQGWSMGQTLGAATIAGVAHVASTALIGSLLVAAGLALNHWVSGLLPYLSAALLFVIGGFYLVRAMVKRPALAGPAGGLAASTGPVVSHAAAFWGSRVADPGGPDRRLHRRNRAGHGGADRAGARRRLYPAAGALGPL